MAQQKNILKLRGIIGGISFYKSKDGYLARENGADFANAASAGKLLRDSVRLLGKKTVQAQRNEGRGFLAAGDFLQEYRLLSA